jgi:hypothetical protein
MAEQQLRDAKELLSKISDQVRDLEKKRIEEKVTEFCSRAEKEQRYVAYAVFEGEFPLLYLTSAEAIRWHGPNASMERVVLNREQIQTAGTKQTLVLTNPNARFF